jgi:hypothetical protein
MRPTRQYSLKKYIAVGAALAGLAFPAAAASYPVIGDNPGSAVEVQLGREYQKTHTNKITHVKKQTQRDRVRTRICGPRGARKLVVVGCVVP